MTNLAENARRLPDDTRHVILSLNPLAGRRSSRIRAERLAETLRTHGQEVEILTDLDEVQARANALFRDGKLRALVGVGGDGTAAELTNRTEPGVPIALLPSGTANILAKHLRYAFQPEKFARMILDGRVAEMDVTEANGRIFLAMVGCGFDAEVVEGVHTARMNNPRGAHINYGTYFGPVCRSIANYRYPLLRTEFLDDSGTPTGEFHDAHYAFLCNLPRYGWGLPLAPMARFDDRELDVCMWRGGSLFGGVWLTILAQLGGLHRFSKRCELGRGRNFRVSVAPGQDVPDADVPYQLDGDPGGKLPVEVRMLARRVTVFVR